MEKTCSICNEKKIWKGRQKFCNQCSYKKYKKNKKRKKTTIKCPNCNIIRQVRTDFYNKRKTDYCSKCSYLDRLQTYKSKYPKELRETDIFKRWTGMKGRCNSKDKKKWYGNISVCDEWLDFNNFYKWSIENGFRKDLEIDRIDETKNYCPSNCQYITHRENTLKIKKPFCRSKDKIVFSKKIKCECGCIVNKYSLLRHKRTEKHLYHLKTS